MARVFHKENANRVLHLKLRCRVTLSDGREVFVKAEESHDRETREFYRGQYTKERVCLDVLRGLAVPKRVALSSAEVEKHIGTQASLTLAQELISGKSLESVPFTVDEKIGVWFFIAEQLCAFRRHEILYSDVKCANVIAARKPLRATIIDFDTCTMLNRKGTYAPHLIGRTPQFAAPEQSTFEMQYMENVVVYQLGVMFTHLLCNMVSGHWIARRDTSARKLKRMLAKHASRELIALILDCVQRDPHARPKNYEEVLARILALPDAKAMNIWRTMRASHQKRLAEVGL